MLDTPKANYSFGSLHKVMEKGISMFLKRRKKFGKVLLLGYGGGSAAEIIYKQSTEIVEITALEIDSAVIRLSKQWFPKNYVDIIETDAFGWLSKTRESYNLVIADLFIHLDIPDQMYIRDFYTHVSKILKPGGLILLNVMIEKDNALQNLERLIKSELKIVEKDSLYGKNFLYLLSAK